ncbi:phage tail tape measure protein [Paracoccus sp. S4493]|uniref:phage tail tape measure protein n=1 Tax=Paracoccus sp. S4493 TaxID=579490 RepID=UPI000696CE03|nr:phage tail tape measure protein [Paracoccus sp. S4493]
MVNAVIGALRVNLGLDSAMFANGLRQSQNMAQDFGRSMDRVGKRFSLAITAPVVAFGGLSLRAAGDFEAAMNRVGAASGASAQELQQLEAMALKMGETTQFKASQAADAIEILAKNGLNASQILGGALEASMLLAASSGSDLASSGDLATDVMLQFGKQAGELTGLVDGMTGVILASKFSFDDYRLAIAQAGGVAGGLGLSFEDFNAAIAGTSSLFASGSDAGTSFKTFLQRLVPASAPAAKAMADLNLEFFTADGSMKSMAEIAQELQDGLAGLSDEARNDALSTIFGTDALRTAIGLAEQGADGIDRLKASIGEASAEEQAAARLKGFNGEMLKLKSGIEALMIAIGNSGLLEWATQFAQQATALVIRLKETNPELLKIGIIAGGVAAALGPLLVGFGLLLQGLGPFVAIVKSVALAAGALGAPFTLAALAIAGAATAIVMNWDTVGPWFTDMANSLGDVFRGLADVILGIVTGDLSQAADGIKTAWNGLDGFFTTLFDGVGAAFERLDERIRAPIEKIKAALDLADRAGRWVESGLNRVTGAGAPSGGTTAPAGADVIVPPTADMQTGLAGGTAGIRVQGVTDADAYGEGFRSGMGIQSPSRRMIEYGEYMSEGLGVGLGNGQPYVTAASDRVGQSFAAGILPYLDAISAGTIRTGDDFKKMLLDMAANLARSKLTSILTGLAAPFLGTVGLQLMGGGDALTGAMRGAGLNAIPALSAGGQILQPGLVQINEKGGELITLPTGATVIPHDLSRQVMESKPAGVDVRVRVDNDGQLQAFVDRRATMAADTRVARFSQAELPGEVANLNQYERDRM